MNNKVLTALNLCYRLLKFRLRTKKEIEDYLKKKSIKYHFSQEDIDKTVQVLEEEGLINDQEFVEWFTRSRVMRKQKSTWVIKRELNIHGVKKEIANEYFLKNPLDENALAYEALSKRWDRWEDLPSDSRYKKAVSFLLRRGFNFDIIKKTIAKFDKKS